MLSALRRRARLARQRPDAGITLIELLVAMVLTSVIGAMALSAFIVMTNATGSTVNNNVGAADARNVVESWTALLQLADSPTAPGSASGRIASITPTKIVFYADSNGNRAGNLPRACPVQYDLSLDDSGRLVQSQTPLTTSPDTGACTQLGSTSTTYPLGDDSHTASAPPAGLFIGYDSNSVPIATCGLEGAVVCDSVARVAVSFEVTTNRNSTPQTFSSAAALTRGTW